MSIYIASDGNDAMMKNNPPPHVPFGLQYYVDAFLTLSSDRAQGAIPFTSTLRYAEFKGLRNVNEFITIMQTMDATYLRQSRKLNEKQDNSAKNDKLQNRAAAHGIG